MTNPYAQTEGRRPAEVILSEANGMRSRSTVTIKSGAGKVKAGTVVGKITSGGKYWPSPAGSTSGEEGAETALAVTLYTVDATDADQEVAVLARDCEVNSNCLEYEATVDTDNEKATKATQLAAVGIVAR